MTAIIPIRPLRLCSHEAMWLDPWMVAAATQQGRHHFSDGVPLQDAYMIGGSGPNVWMVLSDGISKAPLSHVGSNVAVNAVDAFLADQLADKVVPSRQLMNDAFAHAFAELQTHAGALGVSAIDLASTLCAVLLTAQDIFAACVGDSGAAILTNHFSDGTRVPKITPLCTSPQPSSGTFFISDTGWQKALSLNALPLDPIDAVVLTTDGADNFYFDDHTGQTSLNAILDFIGPGLESFPPYSYAALTAAYFNKVRAVNDDDRTLILAFRPEARHVPPAHKAR